MNEIARVSRLNSQLFLGGLMRTLRFRSPHLYLPETVHVKTELTPPTAEQHYEGLTGFNKAETGAKHGKAQNEEIIFQIKEGKHVLIAAHVNSLRGTVKHLESLSEEAIMELNLSLGIPIMYELDKNLKPIKPMQFLGDEETEYAMEAVAAQGKAKK